MSERSHIAQDDSPTLTPAERQTILRRLKHGPVLSREELASYASKLRRQILNERKAAK